MLKKMSEEHPNLVSNTMRPSNLFTCYPKAGLDITTDVVTKFVDTIHKTSHMRDHPHSTQVQECLPRF